MYQPRSDRARAVQGQMNAARDEFAAAQAAKAAPPPAPEKASVGATIGSYLNKVFRRRSGGPGGRADGGLISTSECTGRVGSLSGKNMKK